MNAVGLPNVNSPVVDVNRCVTSPWRQFFTGLLGWVNYLAGLVDGGSTLFQTGDLKAHAANTVPDGWLACDGAAVSRTTYADLFAALGVVWGPGDGVTTFNVPNFRDRFLIGAGGALALGATGGAATHTLSVAELPAHNHTITDPGHYHAAVGTDVAAQIGIGTTGVQTPANTGVATTGITVNNTGGGTPFAMLPPYAAVLMLIKT